MNGAISAAIALRGAMGPSIGPQVRGLALVLFFPELALWLPALVR